MVPPARNANTRPEGGDAIPVGGIPEVCRNVEEPSQRDGSIVLWTDI